jgi:hypothetical protein
MKWFAIFAFLFLVWFAWFVVQARMDFVRGW